MIPAFSLAGREASDCAEARNLQRWVYGFESFGSQALEPDDARAERAAQIGGIGHPIVHYFYCRPFVAELADLLDRARSEEDMDAERARALFATVLAGKPARSALWTLAATMRIHPDEPFIYGRHLWLSGGESLSVSFDPTQSDARMMLNYRFGF